MAYSKHLVGFLEDENRGVGYFFRFWIFLLFYYITDGVERKKKIASRIILRRK